MNANAEGVSAKNWMVKRYCGDVDQTNYLFVKFPTANGAVGKILKPMSIIGRTAELERLLIDKGAVLPREKNLRHSFIESLTSEIPNEAGVFSMSTGWHNKSFLLGRHCFGADDLILSETQNELVADLDEPAGTLDDWICRVAIPAGGSSYVSFAIMHAFAAPLFAFSNLPEGAIFHLSGLTSTGKSTALKAGSSVWGCPRGPTDWNASGRGLDELAAARSDMQLVLDDTKRLREPVAGPAGLTRATHMLTSGRSATYSASVKDQQPTLRWRCWAFSSGELSFDQEYKNARKNRSGGDRTRVIDIKLPSANTTGIWDRRLHKGPGAVRSEKLARAFNANYGHAGIEWIEHLVESRSSLEEKVSTFIARFLRKTFPGGIGGPDRRTAQKFGLIYAAGKMAINVGLLPLHENDPLRICRLLCLQALADMTEAEKPMDELVSRLSKVISHTTAFRGSEAPAFGVDEAADFFLRHADGERSTLFVRRSALDHMFAGDLQRVLAYLQARGIAYAGHGNKNGQQIRVRVGNKVVKRRFMAFDASRLLALVA